MSINRTAAALGMVIATAISAGAASAQIARSDAPIEVTADRVEALRSEGRIVYTQTVKAVQGDTRIDADKLTIVCARPEPVPGQLPSNDCDEIVQMIAEGNVYYITPRERVRGDRAEYDYRADTITMTGDVIMSRGQDGVIRGTRLVYNVGEGRATITAGQRPVQSIFRAVERNPDAPVEPAQP